MTLSCAFCCFLPLTFTASRVNTVELTKRSGWPALTAITVQRSQQFLRMGDDFLIISLLYVSFFNPSNSVVKNL